MLQPSTSPSSQPISVVLAADNNYAMPLAVTARSCLENLNPNTYLQLFLIDGGISLNNIARIEKSLISNQVSITWIRPKRASLGNIQTTGKRITITAYYRLLLTDLLPPTLSKVIYLDCDTIVLSDLEALWKLPVQDHYVLAVQDLYIPYVSSPRGLKNFQDLGIPAQTKYFNSGVLVINLEKWRTENLGQRAITYTENNFNNIVWHDQDSLNAVIAGQWGELDLRWNQMHMVHTYASWKDAELKSRLTDQIKELIEAPYIIHFSSAPKPWELNCKHPGKGLFFQYLANTAWSLWQFRLWLQWQQLWLPISKFIKQKWSRVWHKVGMGKV